MKTIIVYGPGCAKCTQTMDVIRRVIGESGVQVDLRKVSDLREIVMAGIMSTPAIKVDDVVTLTGRVPTADEIKHWIAE
jgi:small redox-active disulfide protein 2